MSGSPELLYLSAAATLAGVSAGQLARAARDGKLPGAERDGGRWKVTPAGALAYRTAKRGAGRPLSSGLEVEHLSTPPAQPEWRARIGGGKWSVSDTERRAVKAAHAAARKRRLIEVQRPTLRRWYGAPRRELAPAAAVAAGARVVVRSRRQLRRGVVLEVTGSGRVTVGWAATPEAGAPVSVVTVAASEVLREVK